RKHVLEDLQPYICTFESCTQRNELFMSRQDWYYHEIQNHRREWVCNLKSCENRVFRSRSSFHTHLCEMHNELAFISNYCEVPALSEQKCPLCSALLSPAILKNHLADHLSHIALFTLPMPDPDASDRHEDSLSNHSMNQNLSRS
ncbi:hypothetical protein BDZ91DRAFT_659683, partial [Kalaharituber pfeilii]